MIRIVSNFTRRQFPAKPVRCVKPGEHVAGFTKDLSCNTHNVKETYKTWELRLTRHEFITGCTKV